MSATDAASLRATGSEDWPLRWRPLPALLLVFAGYYLGAKIGFALTFSPNPISVLWPPNSILLAALLLAPRRMWPLVLLAAFPAHLLAQLQSSVPAAMVLCWFVSNATEALIGAMGVRLFIQRPLKLDNTHEVAVFIACAGLMAPFLSSFLDAAFVRLNEWGTKTYWELWTTRLFSNMLSAITLIPVILTAASMGLRPLRSATPARLVEAGALAVGLLATGVLVFDFDAMVAPSLPLYLPVPFLAWAALRFGVTGASASVALIAFITVWGAAHGRGPFIGSSPAESAFIVQLFLTFVSITTLTLAAVMEEHKQAEEIRKRAQDALRERAAHLRTIAISAPIDRTERQELQQTRLELAHIARVSTLGELAASLAHELNQPLTAILTNAHAALRVLGGPRVDLEEVRAILQDIVEDDTRASEVIRRMRVLTRKGELELAPLDLTMLIKEVSALVQSDVVIRGVRLSMEVAPGLMVRGDKVQLQQVMLNLLLNAFDAVKQEHAGQRAVIVRAQRTEGSMVRVAVSDSGAGLPEDKLETVFAPFFTSKRDGLGLGLSISRSIVEAHGGSIRAVNNDDRGATFDFVLPSQ